MTAVQFEWWVSSEMASEDKRRLARMNQAFHWTRQMSYDEFALPFSRHLLMRHRGQVIGYIGCHEIVDTWEIHSVYLHPQWRGQGLAQQLVAELIDRLADAGMRMIYLEVRSQNTPARRLYAGAGFVQVGTRQRYYQDPVDDAIVMTYEMEGSD